MHRWPLLLSALPTAALLLLAADPARAEDGEAAATEPPGAAGEPLPDSRAIDWSEWTPSASGGIGIFAQHVNSNLRGRFQIGNPGSVPPTTLEDEFEKTLNGPYFPFDVQLLAPTLRRLPGRPRLFVQGGYGWSREEKNLLARRFHADLQPTPNIDERSFMQLFAKPEDLILGGFGSSFQFALGDYAVFFKPSFNFFAQRAVVDAILLQEPAINEGTLSAQVRADQWFYYVGPMLELAAEVGRQGPVGFQVFANTSVAFAISDRDISIGGLGNPADPADPDSYYFQYDNLRVTGGAGLRLLWYGAE